MDDREKTIRDRILSNESRWQLSIWQSDVARSGKQPASDIRRAELAKERAWDIHKAELDAEKVRKAIEAIDHPQKIIEKPARTESEDKDLWPIIYSMLDELVSSRLRVAAMRRALLRDVDADNKYSQMFDELAAMDFEPLTDFFTLKAKPFLAKHKTWIAERGKNYSISAEDIARGADSPEES